MQFNVTYIDDDGAEKQTTVLAKNIQNGLEVFTALYAGRKITKISEQKIENKIINEHY